MAKSNKMGRPLGPKKEAVNVSMLCDRAKKLRELAKNEQKTISIMVENAIEQTYSI
jgi:hypothetical protein